MLSRGGRIRSLRKLLLATGLLAGLAAAGSVMAQSADPAPPDARLAKRLDPRTHQAVAALMDTARTHQLPLEPVVQKALEGGTKQAPGERIVAAVRGLIDRLLEARRILGDGTGEPELTAGAAALFAGVDSAGMAEFQRAVRLSKANGDSARLSLAVGLIVLTDIVERGVDPDSAAGVMIGLAESGLGDRMVLAMRDAVGRTALTGNAPSDALRRWLDHHMPEWQRRTHAPGARRDIRSP